MEETMEESFVPPSEEMEESSLPLIEATMENEDSIDNLDWMF